MGTLRAEAGLAPDRPDVGQPARPSHVSAGLSGSAGPRTFRGRPPCPPQACLAARHTAMGGQPRRWWRLGQGPGGSRGLSAAPRSASLRDLEGQRTPCEPACTRDGGGAPGAQTALSPLAVPATSLSLVSAPCVAASRGPLLPSCQGPSAPFSQRHSPMLSAPFHHFGGCPSHSQVETFKPSPTATPAWCPLPTALQMGPTCKMWQDEPAWPAKNAPGSCPGAGDAAWRSSALEPTGIGVFLLPGNTGRPPEGRVGLGHQMLLGCWDKRVRGLGVGEEVWSGASQLGGPTLAPVKSDLVSRFPPADSKTRVLLGPLTEGPHLTEAALPLP